MGENLLRGQTQYLVGIVNLNDVHWVSFVIDFPNKRILIGDSLHEWPFESGNYVNFLSVLNWWIKQTADVLGLECTEFGCGALEVNRQTDANSCGIFAYNSLHHFIQPHHAPLLQAHSIAGTRIRLALEIFEIHCQNSVCICLCVGWEINGNLRCKRIGCPRCHPIPIVRKSCHMIQVINPKRRLPS